METRPSSQFVQTAFAAAILSLLNGAAGAQAPWNTTGNSGTNPAANFLGTVDDQPLILKSKGIEGLRIEHDGRASFPRGFVLRASSDGDGITLIGSRSPVKDPGLLFTDEGGFRGVLGLVTGWGGWMGPGPGTPLGNVEPGDLVMHAYTGTVWLGGAQPIATTPTLSVNPGVVGVRGKLQVLEQQLPASTSTDPSLLFGYGNTGEFISSQREPGDHQWGLDFYTNYAPRLNITNDGNVHVSGKTTTQVLEITGGSDLAEPFAMDREAVIQPGMVVAIDPVHPGQLRLAKHAYDRTVAGIVSGANGIDPGLTLTSGRAAAEHARPVALTGRVYVFADATHNPIQPGDLLTTADIPGHAMKVTDYARAQGAVLGKAMSALPAGKGLILVLVTLQ